MKPESRFAKIFSIAYFAVSAAAGIAGCILVPIFPRAMHFVTKSPVFLIAGFAFLAVYPVVLLIAKAGNPDWKLSPLITALTALFILVSFGASKASTIIQIEGTSINVSQVLTQLGIHGHTNETLVLRSVYAGESPAYTLTFVKGSVTNAVTRPYGKSYTGMGAIWLPWERRIGNDLLVYTFLGTNYAKTNMTSLTLQTPDGEVFYFYPDEVSNGTGIYRYEINDDCVPVSGGTFTAANLTNGSFLKDRYGFTVGREHLRSVENIGIYRPLGVPAYVIFLVVILIAYLADLAVAARNRKRSGGANPLPK